MDKTDTGKVDELKEVVKKSEGDKSTEKVTTEKVETTKPDGDTQTPIKKDEKEVTKEKVEKAQIPVSAQERINRMYARLKKEESSHASTKEELDALKTSDKPDSSENGDEPAEPVTMTVEDVDKRVEETLLRREAESQFKTAETQVLLRHPTALNDDGSFNMEDPFTKAYVEVGRQNRFLLTVPNGPEIAETMVEKQLGLNYKKGREDEAGQLTKAEEASTGVSTTKSSPQSNYNLSDAEKKVAHKSGMTEKQYFEYKSKRDSGNKRVT